MLRRTLVSALAAAAVALSALVLATPALAQGPGSGPGTGGQGGMGFHGSIPTRGGYGLMLMDQDMTRDQVMLQLRDQDCEPIGLGWFAGGRWSTYIPGAPPWVNQDFPDRMRTGGIYSMTCENRTPVALRLTDTDNGGAFTVAAQNRVRVALNGNPTTGYTWTVSPTPNAAVLVQNGDPFYVASSALLGASGHQVFDFTAVGPGTVQLQLQYARPFESVPPSSTWAVTITVTP